MGEVLSNVVEDGKRTVVIVRGIKGVTNQYYSFKANQSSLPFITALGGTPDFQQHVSRAPSSISLLDLKGATCICRQRGGTIDGYAYNPRCAPWPLSDPAKNRNTNCDVSTYVGGLAC